MYAVTFIFIGIVVLCMIIANRTYAGFNPSIKRTIYGMAAGMSIFAAMLMYFSGTTVEDLFAEARTYMRGRVASSLLERTISAKTFAFARDIDIDNGVYVKSTKSFSYFGSYFLFGRLAKFHGRVNISCDELRVSCMNATFYTVANSTE
jgi:hypothetical protein